jgi:hypothetical protein
LELDAPIQATASPFLLLDVPVIHRQSFGNMNFLVRTRITRRQFVYIDSYFRRHSIQPLFDGFNKYKTYN